MGFVQPVGLVVSPTVMVNAQVVPDHNMPGRQREFKELLEETGRGAASKWKARDLRQLFIGWLGWEESDLVDSGRYRDTLEIALPELQAVLSATWVVPDPEKPPGQWMMLIRVDEPDTDFDKPPEGEAWSASRQSRFERLLRETGVPIGLLCNDERIRLIYAPKGESSGHITFEFSQMAVPAGRPILSAFEMLLSAISLFVRSEESRLPSLLQKSREAQAEVSTRLSRQVLAALYELLRGFVAADARNGKGALTDLARREPDHVYGGLITALMRLVFVLYTEDRGLMSDHPVYQQHYSLGGLFSRLRTDAAAWPDTMDQRFGAWAQLLALFRLVHGGGRHAGLSFVARQGGLFDPKRFPFLEGQTPEGQIEIPMVPDSTVWNVLQNLMMLDGERLSYRTLDVEQIGSVYEAIMGFRIELTKGRSIGVKSQKRTGPSVIFNLDAFLVIAGGKRAKALQDATDQKLRAVSAAALRDATDPVGLVAALDRRIDRDATPDIVPAQVPVLQPTDERRRSGSHYTPRSLTEPIVSEALRPVFERLGPNPKPEEILDLKILDPATGSGAFLVEACRQLSEKLVEAWNIHRRPADLPVDEDDLVYARRIVAQRCLYGVDKNPMAIDLARLSLWLATLAKNHEFTFIDHALRHGDSLVGLTKQQIERFHWQVKTSTFQLGTETVQVRSHVARVSKLRERIREIGDDATEQELTPLLDESQEELQSVRRFGGLVLDAFFAAEKPKARDDRRRYYADLILQDKLDSLPEPLQEMELAIQPFHWEVEFPEVFDRKNPGFDAVVGNPPFQGGRNISAAQGEIYAKWLTTLHEGASGGGDLVAHFFRRAFSLLRKGGTFGLIATNTIAQGDTRTTGLRWVCKNGGVIYRAHRRIKWPGEAAVVVSVVHVMKGTYTRPLQLDGKEVGTISAFLFHAGGHDDPSRLAQNSGKSFQGSIVLGMGFTFDDTDTRGIATPIAEMNRLIRANPGNETVILPFIGGQEVNSSPTHAHHRYIIDFGERDELYCRQNWPELLAIVEQNVKPERIRKDANKYPRMVHEWWKYWNPHTEMRTAIAGLDRVLAISAHSKQTAFAFLNTRAVFSHGLIVFPFEAYAAFCTLQSRPHEIWARFFGSSLEDRLRYTPSDCFETFPFPKNWECDSSMETIGNEYYAFRAALMSRRKQGFTDTYNRFHNPEERSPEIVDLRILHEAMDRAVLDAYGWYDLATRCEFLLDYEMDEEDQGNGKKPWRFRWPDEIRDEVLARLLALNGERAREEQLAGAILQ